jgi:hypothetical protein
LKINKRKNSLPRKARSGLSAMILTKVRFENQQKKKQLNKQSSIRIICDDPDKSPL